ncbi:putative integrase [Sulfuracidifex tepidarius]|nr:putative integrase [Sulfuracidifex tepidarius]
MENDSSGKRRDHYVGPLNQVVKNYLGVVGGTPQSGPAGI